MKPIVTLTTDFGMGSHFVGSMKGVILSINPTTIIVDITHEISPHNIFEASYVIEEAAKRFPKPTIHIVVVDPGVGSDRRPIIAVGEDHYYIAPDNGVLSRVYQNDVFMRVHEVTEEHYLMKTQCKTFHGRDVFAPVGAWMSKLWEAGKFGAIIEDYKKISYSKPSIVKDRTVKAEVVFIDRFGNIVTNLERGMYEQARKKFPGKNFKLKIKNTLIKDVKEHYFQVEKKGDFLALFGSLELLEISAREASAADLIGAESGEVVFMYFGE